MLECALPLSLGVWPDCNQFALCGCSSDTAVSYSVASTNCPRPERCRSITASSTPITADRPVVMSTTGTPTRRGPGAGVPLTLLRPATARPPRVVAGRAAGRPIGAEAAAPAVDQAREALAQRLFIADAPALQRADLEVLDQHVGVRQQLENDLAPFGLGQVDHDIALVAVQAVVVGRRAVVGKGWAPGAGLVASGRLDLDDLRAVVGQNLSTVRATEHA